jgi:predicted secreted hydrolase
MPEFIAKILLLTGLLLLGLACTDSEQHKNNNSIQNSDSMFSGLTVPSGSFTRAEPGYQIAFPADHASHPKFAIEWWYVTANLKDDKNNAYALQWTLFRFASDNPATPWANAQQFMGHVALKTQGQSWFEERFARGGVGNAGVSTRPFNAYIDNWQWLAESQALFPSSIELSIKDAVKAKLELTSNKPFLLHGEQGYSRKLRNSQQASYYYSQPHIDVVGELDLPQGNVNVSGQAWFDHEWTSEYLTAGALGWDWFSVHFDNGAKLMLFKMRHQQSEDFWSGTLLTENRQTILLSEEDIIGTALETEIVDGKSLPLTWSIKLPKQGFDIKVSPMQVQQWNPGRFAYYEGGTVISGSHTGVGFIELTGY